MMRGNNELHLNGATMQRIVQEWIDREIKSKPQVRHVSHHETAQAFIVKLADPLPDCADPTA